MAGRSRSGEDSERDGWTLYIPVTRLQWAAFILHGLLIKLFIIVAIIGVQSLSIGIFFNLPTPTASRWVSTILLVGSNLLSTVSQPLIPTSVRVHMFADILSGYSIGDATPVPSLSGKPRRKNREYCSRLPPCRRLLDWPGLPQHYHTAHLHA